MTADDVVILRLRRCMGLALLLLVATSWPLWTAAGELPQIPWISALTAAPAWVNELLCLQLLFGCVATCIGLATESYTCRASAILALTLGCLVLFDQHRLQPWTYEFLLLLTILATARGPFAVRCLRAIVVSIYFWSGVSKIDPGFAAGHGQMLLDGLLRAVSIGGELWPDGARQLLAWTMPVAELLVAVLLVFARSRVVGLVASILLHTVLLFALGPWGLDHEWGVLLWNGYFIVQNLILFSPVPADQTSERVEATGSRLLPGLITVAAAVLPAMNPFGYWDHWPSWSVYSAHPAVVEMYVRDPAVEQLPDNLKQLVDPPLPLQDWRRVRLDQWSFAERSVPPYPQERWKLAVALAVSSDAGLAEDVRVVVRQRDGWWNASGSTETADGIDSIAVLTKRFPLNVEPRR